MPKKKPKTYQAYRAQKWEEQGGGLSYEKVDFHGSHMRANGAELDRVYLEPKKILFFKDVWHCPSATEARKAAREILNYADISDVKWDRRWVRVDFHQSGEWQLPGQETDDRKNVRGRR